MYVYAQWTCVDEVTLHLRSYQSSTCQGMVVFHVQK